MKFERTERLQPHTLGKRFSCFLYVDHAHDHGDAVYVGSEDGKVSWFQLMANSSKISNAREMDLPADGGSHHAATVNCIMHSKNEKLTPPTMYGILFTGASDRLVKVWDSDGNNIQNLPHTGPVLRLSDARDGSLLSISIDGYLRVWAPQIGREMMLNPFFECVAHLSTIPSRVDGWLGAALAVNTSRLWSCYIGDSEGTISTYRKPAPDLNSSDEENAALSKQLKLHSKWDKMHTLGITSLHMLASLDLLVTMSADCTAKVLDPVQGQLVFLIQNTNKCSFTGMAVVPGDGQMLMVDELGYMTVFDFNKEKVVGEPRELEVPRRVRRTKILSAHKDPMMGEMSLFRGGHKVLVFVHPKPKRGLTDRAAPVVSGLHAHDIDHEGGEIALWCPTKDDTSLREFNGHEGHVVAISAYVPISIARKVATTASANVSQAAAHVSIAGDDASNLDVESLTIDGGSQVMSRSEAMVSQMRASFEHKDDHENALSKDNKHVFCASREEQVFFSAGLDGSIRCWDEFDCKEAFQFRMKNMAEICCMHTIWPMNIIATGHENGVIRLWNSDAGSWVTSPKVLKEPLMCLVEARNARAHLLCGGDYSGRIAVWNLTTFKVNQSELPVETSFEGPHDREEPAILSITYHAPTQTFFSGGNDRTIRLFRIGAESSAAVRSHGDAVCCLESSTTFLLSGDDSGEIILWRIFAASSRDRDSSMANKHLPIVVPAVRFWNRDLNVPAPALMHLHEADRSRVFIVQAGNGVERCAIVWKVWLQSRGGAADAGFSNTDIAKLEELAEKHQAQPSSREKLTLLTPLTPDTSLPGSSSSSRASTTTSRERRTVLLGSRESKRKVVEVDAPRKSDDLFHILNQTNPDVYISVLECQSIRHKEVDATCVTLSLDADDGLLVSEQRTKGIKYIYLGSSQGQVRRYNCPVHANFGEGI